MDFGTQCQTVFFKRKLSNFPIYKNTTCIVFFQVWDTDESKDI